MTRGTTDWTQAKIYKITTPDGFFYYGSTCTSLTKRKSWHKKNAVEAPNRKSYKKFAEVGWHLVKIELVQMVEGCTCEVDLKRVEDTYIKDALEDDKCLNSYRAYTTKEEKMEQKKIYTADPENKVRKQEYDQEYRDANKEKIADYKKDYQQQNKEDISKKRHERYEKNKDVEQAKQKEYAENHKEELKAHRQQYYQENKEALAKQKKEYTEKNKEKIKARRKQYYQENKEKWQNKEVVVCDICGKSVSKANLLRHQKTNACKSHAHTNSPN